MTREELDALAACAAYRYKAGCPLDNDWWKAHGLTPFNPGPRTKAAMEHFGRMIQRGLSAQHVEDQQAQQGARCD